MWKSKCIEYVINQDGVKIPLSEIIDSTSSDLYQTSLHYGISRAQSQRIDVDPTTQKVLENIYTLKSMQIRGASALTAYILEAKSAVTHVCVNPCLKELLDISLFQNIIFIEWTGPTREHLSGRQIFLLIAKCALHRLFRIFARGNTSSERIVRGWVDVTTKMYSKEIPQSLLLIYPFALSLMRQARFIVQCSRTDVDYSFAGMPYPILRTLGLLLTRLPRERILADIEIRANERYANELLRNGIREIFTSDEYEVASFVLYEKLISSGVRVVNTAHGVGQYCPCIAYSEFRLISESQRVFYEQRSPFISYTLLESRDNRFAGLAPIHEAIRKEPMVVLVHQPFEGTQLEAEARALRQLDIILYSACQRLSVTYGVKMHPNHKRRRFGRNRLGLKGASFHEWSELREWRCVFVTINSTTFLDVRGFAPVLVYKAPTFEPELYFPLPFLRIDCETVEKLLENLIIPSFWERAALFHADGDMKNMIDMSESLVC